MHFDIAWQEVDTVLLDMDGTLLGTSPSTTTSWQTLVPETWGAARGPSLQEAKDAMRQEYHAVQHTLNWYCLDYWSERLGLDICAMTSEQGPRATLREDTVPFLDALKACGKRRILLTNAHPHNLAVKLKHTGLDAHLDLLLSTHTFGYPKEDQRLWRAVAEETGLEAHKTLFVDDSEAILDAAREFGIRYCLGITNPDSGLAEKQYLRHPGLNDYRRLIPSLTPRRRGDERSPPKPSDWTNGFGPPAFTKPARWRGKMIEGGKVHYNGQRSKPGKIVELDAILTLRQGQRRADGAHYRYYRTAPPGEAKPSTCMKRRRRVPRSVKKWPWRAK